ncbi:hypothetical protein C0Q70_18248 [Pomacea canaliculata]|uniref:Ras-GAP domain-containing protein n=1 Tax=Pomacea canaliculata TaxID=400727 RepID=A0A2T7NMQ7_POMCA|nr:hypothetical protein C0Q70_18248 [Pomacea canaliculata]
MVLGCVEETEEKESFADGHVPTITWDPCFCVLLEDMGKLTFHGSEEIAEERVCYKQRRRLRLDGGKEEFDKRWGYETLQSIRENALQHSRCHDRDADTHSIASAESFFKTRTLQVRNESLPDSSLEKVTSSPVGERRGSLPLVGAADDDNIMESSTSSTTSRLASFFSRKGFMSNLKRTKSVTKLDRKRSGSHVSENDTSLISSRIRTSRSHESLLSNPCAMQAVDLTSREAEVKAVHPSVLSQDHCFHVNTTHGSKYISCRTAEECDKWLSSLRRTIRPNQEQVRRTDSSLRLWIVEAKNVQPKKRYFCEILLDRKLYARTSSKLMADMLFWGEHFEFRDLPTVETITVNMYREADKKKKKDKNVLVCYISMAVTDISNRQFVEKWFSANSGTVGKAGKETKSDLPLIRMKVRHQTVNILPLDLYQDFIKYLKSEYQILCELLEPLMSVREKEDFATTLVHAMQRLDCAKAFLCQIVMSEIGRLDNEHLTFRGNSIATKAMEAYMKLVGERYLHDTLGEFVRTIVESEDDCEVDPTKVATITTLQCQQNNLVMYSNMAWVKIINSYCYFPNELREVFASFREHCRQHGKEDFSDNLISASIFLRFLCPAILSPSLLTLHRVKYPQERPARNLTLIAKTIQTLANFTKFGGKEEFMTFMNQFIETEETSMKTFLRKISSVETGNQFLQFDGYIDLGRELSLLHIMISDSLERAPEASMQKLCQLSTVLTTLSEALQDPSVGQSHPNRKSQIFYDNMPHGQTTIHSSTVHAVHTIHSAHSSSRTSSSIQGSHVTGYSDTSPTEALRDMLRQCGESEEDLHAFASRAVLRETESAPPSIQTGDDDEFSALYSSASMTSSMSSSTCGASMGQNDRSVGQNDRSEVSNVSVSSQQLVNHENVSESWTQIVSAADSINGDYIDLIPFMDEESQNSSIELEGPVNNGSQISISQLSTVASSGYQSFGYSQSNSPVDGNGQPEITREVTKSPVIHYPLQPLSFSNPLYRHQQLAQHHTSPMRLHHHHHAQPLPQATLMTIRTREDSSSSNSSGDEASTVKHYSPVKLDRTKSGSSVDQLRKLSQLSSSSGSSESLNERSSSQQDKVASSGSSNSVSGANEGPTIVRFALGPPGNSPARTHSSQRSEHGDSSNTLDTAPEIPPRPDRLLMRTNVLAGDGDSGIPPVPPPRAERASLNYDALPSEQRNLGMRPYQLSHSMDFGCLQHQHAEQLRRTATDSVIAKTSTPVHSGSGTLGSARPFSREDSFSSVQITQSQGSLNSRRLSPQSAVHMGISSVQRKLQEQERTKQEYESEVHTLRQQLVEAQLRLQSAEMRLMDHEVETHSLMQEWQSRLAESEQRIRQQQAEKDDQMKSIIERLVTIEEELRKEQAEMQKVVHEKQHVIEVQEQRIRTLDNANAKLLQALAELKEHASVTSIATTTPNRGSSTLDRRSSNNAAAATRNGMMAPMRQKFTASDLSGFKSSTC